MKILLFNDNPVVRKLVALSAQKTKDDLSVIWSVDEIEESAYDLLIVDDALYTNEIMESLKEHITYKSTLLMATRGNAVPAGFENVINKPFLPTDLVDMFIQIDKKIAGSTPPPSFEAPVQPVLEDEPAFDAIDLDEPLPDLNTEMNDAFDAIDLDSLNENDSLNISDLDDEIDLTGELNMDDLEDFDDHLPEAAILDKEELQEVRGLLEETENDDWNLEEPMDFHETTEVAAPESLDEEIAIPDDFSDLMEIEEEPSAIETGSVESDEEGFGELELPDLAGVTEGTNAFDEPELGDIEFDDTLALMDEEEEEEPLAIETASVESDEEGFGELELPDLTGVTEGIDAFEEPELGDIEFDDILAQEETPDVEEVALPPMEEAENDELRLDDDALDNLELQIQDAVNGLEPDVLESELELDEGMELDENILDDIMLPEMSTGEEELSGFDELDMLDERELKLAIGEEVEEDLDIHAGAGDHTSLSAEALDEAMNVSAGMDEFIDEFGTDTELKTENTAEGVEAIQALLKALSNEEVAKSLKGLNISININFGNGA